MKCVLPLSLSTWCGTRGQLWVGPRKWYPTVPDSSKSECMVPRAAKGRLRRGCREPKFMSVKAAASRPGSGEDRGLWWPWGRRCCGIVRLGLERSAPRSGPCSLWPSTVTKAVPRGRTSQTTSHRVALPFTPPTLLTQLQLAEMPAGLHCLENGPTVSAPEGQLASRSQPPPLPPGGLVGAAGVASNLLNKILSELRLPSQG